MSKPKLTHLFTAFFENNTCYTQGLNDESLAVKGKNCYYDVLQRKDEVIAFKLENVETGNEYGVDLSDGHFEINGVPFTIHDRLLVPRNLQLYYFMETNVDVIVNAHSHKIEGQHHYINRYLLGWEMKQNNKTIKHAITIAA